MAGGLPLRLHHVGLVVPRIREAEEALGSLGFQAATEKEADPVQGVSARFVGVGQEQQLYVEILEPDHADSPVSNFLSRQGGGLHHLCFQVEDIDVAAADLVSNGAEMVCAPVDCVGYDRSFKLEGSQATRIAFFLLSGVLLIELLEEGR
jgi:methylmalonyl-CoA/ethylmalonyl-CoA epimerase